MLKIVSSVAALVVFVLLSYGVKANSNEALNRTIEGLSELPRDSALAILDSVWESTLTQADSSIVEKSRLIAKKYRGLNAHSKSVLVYESLQKIGEQLNDTALICESRYYQGVGYRTMGLYNEGLTHLFHSLSLEESLL